MGTYNKLVVEQRNLRSGYEIQSVCSRNTAGLNLQACALHACVRLLYEIVRMWYDYELPKRTSRVYGQEMKFNYIENRRQHV